MSQWLGRWGELKSLARTNPFVVVVMGQERKMSYVLVAERLGMEKGRAEGQAELLLLQIERRFGPVAKAVTQRVRRAQAKDLEAWSLNFVDATTLDDVFRD
ncbi:DUF4351 domain-containing protein [Castellaniella caeni]